MKIKRVLLENFGRHAHLEANIDSDVVGLLGPNGSGKSTLLNAIQFAFTGELSGDTQDTFIKDHSLGINKEAVVEVDFEQNGQVGKITRTIGTTKSSRSFVWNGEKKTAAKDVEDALRDIFSADKKSMMAAIFPAQGQLDKLLFGTPTEREELFVKLLLMSHMAKVASLFEAKIKLIAHEITDLTAVKDEATLNYDASKKALEELAGKLDTSRDWDTQLNNLTTYKQNVLKLERIRGEIDGLQVAINDLLLSRTMIMEQASREGTPLTQDFISELEEMIKKNRGELDELDALYYTTSTNIAEFEKAEFALSSYKKCQIEIDGFGARPEEVDAAVIDSLLKELATRQSIDTIQGTISTYEEGVVKLSLITQEVPQLLEAEIPLVESIKKELDDVVDKYASVVYKLKAMEVVVNSAANVSDKTHCIVCGSEISGDCVSPEKLEELRLEERKLASDKKSLETRYLHHGNQAERYKIQLANAMADLDMKKVAIRDLKNSLPESTNVREASVIQSDIDSLKTKLNAFSKWSNAVKVLNEKSAGYMAVFSEIADNLAHTTLADELISRDNIEAARLVKRDYRNKLLGILENLRRVNFEIDSRIRYVDQKKEEEKSATIDVTGSWYDIDKDIRPDGSDMPGIESVIVTLIEKVNQTQQLKGMIRQAETAMETARKRLNEILKSEEANAAKKALIDDMKRMKELFERDGLPLTYIKYMYGKLVSVASDNLALTNAVFSIWVDSEQSVSVMFRRLDDDSGAVFKQNKLSGGQRVRFTVAFLLAVQQLVIPEVGLLVLDEPSTHLDDEAVESLINLLLDMQGLMQSRNSQLIVCDHNTRLEPAFGKTVRLK